MGTTVPLRGQGHPGLAVPASGFAESQPVSALPPLSAKERGPSRAEEEINEFNRERIRTIDPAAKPTVDTALSGSGRFTRKSSVQPLALPTPATSFEGISHADTVAIGQGFLPPDTNGAVGPNHYVQTVNVAFRVWDKAGNPLTNVASLAALFAPLGGPCATTEDGDPIVLYDQLADRWIISQFCVSVANPNNHQLIAVSKTGDPTGAYFLYDFMMPNNKFNDYPHFSIWPDAYYMTDNQFNQAGNTFQQAGVFAFDRAKMLVGDPTASFVYFDTALLFPPGTANNGTDGIGGMLSANLDGFTPPPAGAPCPFAYFQAGEFGDPGDQLRIFDFHVDFAIPANSAFTERTGSPLGVAAFDPTTVPANSSNVIPQSGAGSTTYLDAIGDRLMFRLSYRNLGTSETLLANHTVNAAGGGTYRAGVRFYQLIRSTPSSAFTIAEQQTWAGAAGDTAHRWMGSLAMNFKGDIALGYSTSGTSLFPGIRYAAKLGTDPAGGGLAQGEALIINGTGRQSSTSGRWGDYSDMTLDPADDCSFWYTQEYYATTGSATWQTRIAKLNPGSVAISPRGAISGTISNCQTGQPIQNAIVRVSGGFLRSTPANGTYSITAAPGTYATATVTASGYSGASASNVIVTNGATTTLNLCLAPIPIPAAGGNPSVVAENFTPANSAVDPGEYVTVNLPVANTGSGNTTNLVGTLQATGGVTNPSGPQTYGVVNAGGPSVSRPFSFLAAGACGNPITLTLALQDGATNFGTITYTMTLGTVSNSIQTFTNASAITIPASGTGSAAGAPATPYPSSIVVSGVPANFNKVTVKFANMNHTFPDDVDVLLVGPTGRKMIVLSDAGSSNAWVNATIILDDAASSSLSDSASNPSGTYKPGNFSMVQDLFPASAPAGPYLTAAPGGTDTLTSSFVGQNPNGTWSLYVVDDASIDTGNFSGGWQLTFTTNNTSCVSNQPPAIINGPPPSPVVVGSPYSFTFVASGNPTPTFSFSGTLPPGLNLSGAGVLAGTASSGGSGNFPNIQVTASNGFLPNATQTFALSAVTNAANYIAGYGLSGANAVLTFDYDGDGLANILEYGLGLDPKLASLAGLPVVTLKDYSGTTYLSMLFNRSALATDLTYIVQASDDLSAWSDLAMSSAGAATAGPGFVNEAGGPPVFAVEVRDTVPYTPGVSVERFLRLKLTRP